MSHHPERSPRSARPRALPGRLAQGPTTVGRRRVMGRSSLLARADASPLLGTNDAQGGIAMIVVVDRQGALLPPLGSDPDSGVRLDAPELHWLAVRAGAESDGAGV